MAKATVLDVCPEGNILFSEARRVALVLIVLGFVLTFPPVFGLFAHWPSILTFKSDLMCPTYNLRDSHLLWEASIPY